MRISLVWIGAVAGVVLAFAANAAVLPVSDFAKHPPLANPVISPDGKYLAVVVNKDTDETNPIHQLAVLQLPDLKPVSRLDMAPRFLPIGVFWVSNTRLVMGLGFETGTLEMPSGTGDIIAVNFDGSHKQTLYSLRNRGSVASGANSQDIPAGWASIAGHPRIRNGHFYVSLSQLPQGSQGDSWNDGKTSLYDVDASTGRAVQIGEIRHGGMDMTISDGIARLAVGADNNLDTRVFKSQDGKQWTPVPDSLVGKTFSPLAISDDGKHRLFALSSMDGGPQQLVESNLDGTGRKVLASDDFSSVTGVDWNPETSTPIAAVFTAGGRPRVQYLSDGIYAQILQALSKSLPDQHVSLSDSSTDGSALLIGIESDRNPGSFALFEKSTMHARPLYQVLPWIDASQMPHRTPIRFKNRDGVELAGLLTLPLDAQKNLPLVLIPHGGPIGVDDSWFFDPWSALLANRGYAALQVNYRGSSGRGRNFQLSGYKEFGSGIQNDLIDGVQWAIAQGYVDPNRICVFGASFGGYSSLMQPILAPKLYKCAVDYAGVYDMRIEIDRSDTRRGASGRQYLSSAVGDRKEAYAMSPASRMDQFNVPVFIVHGKDDERVPYKNATDLRAYLEKAGKPFEWMAKSKEMHGFYGEKNNEEFYARLLEFLARYIGPNAQAAKASGATH